ncbi:hypothetical protein Btru_065086 [Bulinus truncatus]|nr:hypothetical protein Btru_065086 [Bulinus truncatus]
MNALYLELTDDSAIIHNMEEPTVFNTWGMLIMVIAANVFVVNRFHHSVKARLEQESKEQGNSHNDGLHSAMNGCCSSQGNKPFNSHKGFFSYMLFLNTTTLLIASERDCVEYLACIIKFKSLFMTIMYFINPNVSSS